MADEQPLPQNIDAERAILGAILIDGGVASTQVIKLTREALKMVDFYSEKHKVIFRGMIELDDRNAPIDTLSLFDHLKAKGRLKGAGGSSYITLLTALDPSTANVDYYIKIVEDASQKRQLCRAFTTIDYRLRQGELTTKEAISENLSVIDGLTSPRRAEKLEIPRPSKLAEEAFHGLAGKIIKVIEPHSEAHPVALLLTFLTCFGNIIGECPHFKVEADKHRSILFSIFIGPTSKGRKGVSFGHIRQVYETVDPEFNRRIQSGLSSGEGLIWAVRDETTKKKTLRKGEQVDGSEYEIVDEGVDDKRLLILESEFASTLKVMGREGNILSPTIRNAWDHKGDLQTLTKNSPTKATGSHISIIGHITGEELRRYLNSTETANGFGNRFMFFWVERSKKLPFGGEFDITEHLQLTEMLQDAVKFAKDTERVIWAEETRDLWADIYSQLSEGKPGIVGLLTARAEAYATRLACIYALLDKSVEIRPEHLKAALAIWDYVEASTRYIFQEMTGNLLADEIFEALMVESKGLSLTEINNLLGRHKSSEEISTALNLLKSLGMVNIEEIQTKGRSRKVWRACVANENKSTGCEKSELSEKSPSVGDVKGA